MTMEPKDLSVPAEVSALDDQAASIVEGLASLPLSPSAELLARVEEFQQVRAHLSAAPVFPDALLRDTQLAVAVSSVGDQVVVPLRKRRGPSSVVAVGIAAAAALLLVAVSLTSGVFESGSDDVALEALPSPTTYAAANQETSGAVEPVETQATFATESDFSGDAPIVPESLALERSADLLEGSPFLDLQSFEETATERFFARRESAALSHENSPCGFSLTQQQELLGELPDGSEWLPVEVEGHQQELLVIFGHFNLLIVDPFDCLNRFLVEVIVP